MKHSLVAHVVLVSKAKKPAAPLDIQPIWTDASDSTRTYTRPALFVSQGFSTHVPFQLQSQSTADRELPHPNNIEAIWTTWKDTDTHKMVIGPLGPEIVS